MKRTGNVHIRRQGALARRLRDAANSVKCIPLYLDSPERFSNARWLIDKANKALGDSHNLIRKLGLSETHDFSLECYSIDAALTTLTKTLDGLERKNAAPATPKGKKKGGKRNDKHNDK